jgi:hypothetical protein
MKRAVLCSTSYARFISAKTAFPLKTVLMQEGQIDRSFHSRLL